MYQKHLEKLEFDAKYGKRSELISDDEEEESEYQLKTGRSLKKDDFDSEKEALKHPDYIKLERACYDLIETENQGRIYYYINILKLVKVYEAYESFGELALITNKRRKAKLECSADTHFATLSRDHYR